MVDYTINRALAGSDRVRTRRLLLLASLTFNIGVLGFFKYFNFFQVEACRLVAFLGMHLSPIALQVVLPVGISFYTFKSLSYTIDVYRRVITATDHLQDYAIFVAFFPQHCIGRTRSFFILNDYSMIRYISVMRVLFWPGYIFSDWWMRSWMPREE